MAVVTTADISTTFDAFLAPILTKLVTEYDKNRIRGPEYSKVYIAMLESAMSQAVAFELGKQQADKTAELLVKQALGVVADTNLTDERKAKVILEKGVVSAQKLDIEQTTAYSKTKETVIADDILQIRAQVSKINQDTTVGVQQKLVLIQDILNKKEQVLASITGKNKSTSEKALIDQNLANAIDTNVVIKNTATKVLSENTVLTQKKLTEEAQIVDRVTGAAADVSGVLGKQKSLYGAQTDGFARDAEQKLLKALLDTYTVRRTTDTGTVTPSSISDAELNKVVDKAKLGVGVV